MGKSFFKENWETEFKEDVRNIQKGSGLTVSSNRQGNIEVNIAKMVLAKQRLFHLVGQKTIKVMLIQELEIFLNLLLKVII